MMFVSACLQKSYQHPSSSAGYCRTGAFLSEPQLNHSPAIAL